MDSMKKYRTFEAWVKAHIRGDVDPEKFRPQWDAIHAPEEKEAPKPRRRRRRNEETD